MNKNTQGFKFELIQIKDLVADHMCQKKSASASQNRRFLRNFDSCFAAPIKVVRRNGVNFIINGQATVAAIAYIIGSLKIPVWCEIYDDIEFLEFKA